MIVLARIVISSLKFAEMSLLLCLLLVVEPYSLIFNTELELETSLSEIVRFFEDSRKLTFIHIVCGKFNLATFTELQDFEI